MCSFLAIANETSTGQLTLTYCHAASIFRTGSLQELPLPRHLWGIYLFTPSCKQNCFLIIKGREVDTLLILSETLLKHFL